MNRLEEGQERRPPYFRKEGSFVKMQKKTAGFLSIFSILIALSLSILAQDSLSQSKKNFLWRVQSKTNTVYILGSIHYLKKESYPLHEKIENAFHQCAILVVETNVNDEKRMNLQKLAGPAFYPGNETFEDHVSPKTNELVKKELVRQGIPLDLVQKQKPWLLAVTLASFEILKLGFDPNYGIDQYFLSKAIGKKEILELESFDFQIDLFSKFSEKEQELFLIYTLEDIKVLERELNRLIQAWTSGDTKNLEAIIRRSVQQDKRLTPIYSKLIDERNRNMASKIEDYLKTKETYFVIVGAGHLVGKQGIIGILERKGFAVEQL
jgi:uncharacterized protein YbaP (TraB family)